MKKLLLTLYSACFFAACAVPGIMLLKSDSSGISDSEKRALAEAPAVFDESGKLNRNWNREFEDYVSDNFGFRTSLVNADSVIKSELFKTSAEDNVIIGKDGWLFYAPTTDDFIGNPTVSALGISNIARNLELMQEFAAGHNSRFVVAVVPDKNTVYPEFMPDNYIKSGEKNNLDNLTETLADSNVNYCDLRDAITNEKSTYETPLYHKTDTHWNNTGALVGYRNIMKQLDIIFDDYNSADYITEKTWTGDLNTMLFPDSDDKDYQNEYNISFNYSYLGHYRDADDITINTLNTLHDKSLLMFRDSFGAAIIPYFSENFGTARYSRARPYPMYNLEIGESDVTVLEIVERNIAWLQREAPMHSAVKVNDIPKTDNSFGGTIFFETINSYLHIYGTDDLSENFTSAPEKYITLTDSHGNSSHYKAYNCYESELLNDENIYDNGYSLYISSNELTENEEYNITLTLRIEDNYFACDFGKIIYKL